MTKVAPAGARKRRTKATAGVVTAVQVESLAPGEVLTIGGGLSFRATGRNEASGKTFGRWTFRYSSRDPAYIARQEAAGSKTRQREMGLGPFPEVSLKAARQEAARLFAQVRAGIDPLESAAREQAVALADARRGRMTFAEASDKYLAAKLDQFRNAKHRDQWRSTLASYAMPVIGALSVDQIDTAAVLRVLQQDVCDKSGSVEGTLWQVRTETASRLRGRIEAVLAWATVSGHRSGDNPARWEGNLRELLPAPNKIARTRNQAALALDDAARWFADLRRRDGFGARALEFLALTAARSGEARGARWDEIDLVRGLWTIPAGRMKMEREHVVPLSRAALDLLNDLPRVDGTDYLFPSARGRELSDMTLSAAMKRMHEAASAAAGGDEAAGYLDPRSKRPAVPHGLRSTFRDWAAERTTFPGDMAEMALAHRVGNAVEAAYRRGDMVEKRRAMMAAWADFLEGKAATSGAVVAFPAGGAA